jgi:hypothetical protein
MNERVIIMAKDWSYSVQSHVSKEYGGPKQYAEMLINLGMKKGKTESEKRLIPVFIGLTAVTVVAVKVYDYFKYNRDAAIQNTEKKDIDSKEEHTE